MDLITGLIIGIFMVVIVIFVFILVWYDTPKVVVIRWCNAPDHPDHIVNFHNGSNITSYEYYNHGRTTDVVVSDRRVTDMKSRG